MWVSLPIGFHHHADRYAGVNLRSREPGMSKECGHSLEWGPMVMHVGAAGVAQQVGMVLGQSLRFCDLISAPNLGRPRLQVQVLKFQVGQADIGL